MRQLTVELEEEDMAQLEATARARRIDRAHVTKAQLLTLLGAGTTMRWRAGLGARRAPVAVKGAKIVFICRPKRPREDQAVARARRMEALMSMQGIWKGDVNKPQDGVAYQQEVRAEWR